MHHSIAVIHRRAPHGSAGARESLDALLALSAYTEQLAVFFLGDGVYQLLGGQQPEAILGRNISPTFRMLELYDIEQVYVCRQSLASRGLTEQPLLLDARRLSPAELAMELARFGRFINL